MPIEPESVAPAGPAPADFHARSSAALQDPQIRANFRRAMDGLMAKRAALFADPAEWRDLRALGAAIRARSLARLPELLERLEERCRANGIEVHWAETTAEANAAVLAILRAHGATRVVKGKSMVSEEMHLNDFLEANGVESLESDLGEYIVQLDHEMPSHIVMPVIHKNLKQIARLFGQKIRDAAYTEDVDELTAMARRVLRRKFEEADAAAQVLQAGEARNRWEDRAWGAWRWVHGSARIYSLVSRLLTRCRRLPPPPIGPLRAWTSVRTRPRPARRSLHELARRRGVPDA